MNIRWISRPENQPNIDWDAQYNTPLEGNEFIKPITSYRELHKQGTEQMHCIVVFYHLIIYGVRFYRPAQVAIKVEQ